MIDNDLVPYIEKNLQNGTSSSSISNMLSLKGHSQSDINDTISFVKDNLSISKNLEYEKHEPNKKKIYGSLLAGFIMFFMIMAFFFATPIKTVSEKDMLSGTDITMQIDSKIKFEHQDDSHTISINNIDSKTASITIASNPIKSNITEGEEQKFDLNDDDYYDIKITLISIDDPTIRLNIKNINESTCVNKWQCDEWSSCTTDNTQTRECIDINECSKTDSKPIEIQSCDYYADKKNEIDISPQDIELDILHDKKNYNENERVTTKPFIQYKGPEFEALMMLCYGENCVASKDNLHDIDFSKGKTGNWNYSISPSFEGITSITFSLKVYQCKHIDEALNSNNCGENRNLPVSVANNDQIKPLKSKKSNINIIALNVEDNSSLNSTVENITEEKPINTVVDCFDFASGDVHCTASEITSFTDTFQTNLAGCQFSQGSFGLGFEPVIGIYRSYSILESQNDNCQIQFTFLDNPNLNNSLKNKSMVCEYDQSQRDLETVSECLDCCEGELKIAFEQFLEDNK